MLDNNRVNPSEYSGMDHSGNSLDKNNGFDINIHEATPDHGKEPLLGKSHSALLTILDTKLQRNTS